jgi:hypothetical protein
MNAKVKASNVREEVMFIYEISPARAFEMIWFWPLTQYWIFASDLELLKEFELVYKMYIRLSSKSNRISSYICMRQSSYKAISALQDILKATLNSNSKIHIKAHNILQEAQAKMNNAIWARDFLQCKCTKADDRLCRMQGN